LERKLILFACHKGGTSGIAAGYFRKFAEKAAPGAYNVEHMALDFEGSYANPFDEQKLLNADHIVCFYDYHLRDIGEKLKKAGTGAKMHYYPQLVYRGKPDKGWNEQLLEEIAKS